MSWTRRDVLASLGVASAGAILLACGGRPRGATLPNAIDPQLRTWLKDAVSILRGAGFASVHALAVSRRRTTGAIDLLGAGVARGRADGLVFTVRDKTGQLREQVTNDLSRDGVLAAVRVLAGNARAVSVDFGADPAPVETPRPDPDDLSDGYMLERVGMLARRDAPLSSRIVYAASLIDIDDARVWSVAPGRTLEQRLVRVRRSVTRVAWHGTRPVISEAARAWSGDLDAQDLSDEELVTARENALSLVTQRAFEDREYAFMLEPAVAANLIDVAVRALLTTDAQRRPEITRRLATARGLSTALTLVDDPTAPGAYGGMRFDDRGELASARPLVTGGQLVGRIEPGRRPGHVGRTEALPSHLRVTPGATSADTMLDAGLVLEQPVGTLVDPASDRVIIQVARAREVLGGRRTGRMYADIELVGELTRLFGTLGGMSSETRAIGLRDEVDGQPRWRSIDTPWLRGTAVVRQRRRPT